MAKCGTSVQASVRVATLRGTAESWSEREEAGPAASTPGLSTRTTSFHSLQINVASRGSPAAGRLLAKALSVIAWEFPHREACSLFRVSFDRARNLARGGKRRQIEKHDKSVRTIKGKKTVKTDKVKMKEIR